MATLAPNLMEEKYQTTIIAWETLAPDKSFGGMTLVQFKATVKPSQDARQRIRILDTQMTDAIKDRETGDEAVAEALELVVNGVRADKTVGGADGALYKEMGYVPKSERKPRTRKPAG
ncbi:hypothetical protein [Armatimonas sp.]|uniref:hypothetical protein n=1 Tax=Armatimonas sp. TaxID=1872638 RepID=UPI003752E40F